MRNGLPLHAGMSVGQKQRRRKNKKTYCHAVQPKLQSQKKMTAEYKRQQLHA